MTKEELFALMKGTIIVSCQATQGEPLYDKERSVMPLMARAAKQAGAKMIRTSSVRDIVGIKEETGLPVIGLIKREYPGYTGRITMTMREVDECMEALSDIISIDCTVLLDGYQADMARTFPVGEISPEAQALIDAAKESFGKGLAFARKGYRIGDISHAIQTSVEGHGYGVVRSLCGHGIGKEMHEDPEVPNFGKPGHGLRLREGLCIAVEPMITAGDYRVYIAEDNWAFLTRDHSLSAHYENTLAITESGEALILTMPDGFDGEDV